jgi:exosortase O
LLTAEPQAQSTIRPVVALPAGVLWVTNSLIAGLWLWLYWPVFAYLSIIFGRADFRTNQVMLAGVLVLVALRIRRGEIELRLALAPRLAPLPLLFALGGSLLYLVVERLLNVNTLSASLFVLATYGLLGLWWSAGGWRSGLPAALLLMGVLPFGEHLQTFVGYPMRILTAQLVRDGLLAAGVQTVGIDTILVFENGISHVDLPCSGVRSLWAGMVFLVAASWVEGRPFNGRWLLVAAIFSGLLFVANLVRVGVLVVVGQVAGWRLAAEMLHVPLGVLGFVIACAVAVLLLRLTNPPADPARIVRFAGRPARLPVQPVWLSPLLIGAILAMALVYQPRPASGLGRPAPVWHFPTELASEPFPLKANELAWLAQDGAESAERRRFAWRGITGSVLLIPSTTWRAHHNPERCFAGAGLEITLSQTHLVSPAFPVRFLTLGDRTSAGQQSATYWFQSAERTSDDYATRIWADLAVERQRWVLVAVLFDQRVDPHAAEITELYTVLYEVVAQTF